MEEVYFKDLEMRKGLKVSECEVVSSHEKNNVRLYVSTKDISGFNAIAVRFASSSICEDHWVDEDLMVDVLFTISAAGDGVRHMEINREGSMSGYIHYPGTSTFIELFTSLRELEKKYCPQADN